MLPPDVAELATLVPFRRPETALAHLAELAEDPAEMLALAQLREHLADALAHCADPDAGLLNLSRFVQAWGARLPLFHLFRDHPASLDALVQVIAASRYLADVLVRNPEFFDFLGDSSFLRAAHSLDELAGELEKTCAPFATSAARLDAVRRFRRREILRIGAADLLGLADLRQTTEQLSHLADAVIGQCLRIVSDSAEASGLIVLALGKLGGGELNYSSDIDLIFLAEREEQLPAATRQAQRLVAALGDASAEGFLYRVDLRLRPYGGSGALVVTSEMFRDYLKSQAHPAQRQAMLKARPVAGAIEQGRALLRHLTPLWGDDAATAKTNVRRLKERIEEQLTARGEAAGHVKLAPGGIRDIEFIVQALQLQAAAHGLPASAGTLAALAMLEQAGWLDSADADELHDAYVVLRLVEHQLQLMDNRQVHRLPDEPGELTRLARSLGFSGPDEGDKLREAYAACSRSVRAIYERVLDVGQVSNLSKETLGQVGNLSYAERHAQLLARIVQPGDVELWARRDSDRQWTVAIAARDHPGLLSILTGLFAARHIDILRGDVRTLRPSQRPASPPKRRARSKKKIRARREEKKILDVFTVRTDEWRDASFWRQHKSELAALIALLAEGRIAEARQQVIEQVSRRAEAGRPKPPPLYPVAIQIDNDADPQQTQLSIRAVDTTGFLFEFTSALATLNVHVERVEIRTVAHEVRDTFWVTGADGRKILDPDRLHELRVAAALIKQFTHLLPACPNPAQALEQFGALTRQLLSRPEWVSDLASLESDSVLRTLAELMGVSQFLWEDFLRMQHENLFPVVRDIPALDEAKSKSQLERELSQFVERNSFRSKEQNAERNSFRSKEQNAERNSFRSKKENGMNSVLPHDELVARLNRFKDREMFRIDLRHITRRIDLEAFSSELSDLAEVVVAAACELCHGPLRQQFGVPRLAQSSALAPRVYTATREASGPQPACGWSVCGLGKFGGRELGFASDIELVFVYEGDGMTDGASPISNARYFEELAAAFLRTLTARREGVFEIDLRLRPHGKAGSLACSLAGFADYYSPPGAAQQFERLALVKLRPVAGDGPLADRLLAARDAFVYSSRPLDYENIDHLRRRQAAELVRARRTSAKHSPGGLVDIEYFVQARQIEAGRDEPDIRVTNTRLAIQRLSQAGFLAADLARELAESYCFLRQLIEGLRVVRGHAKDLTIPAAGTPEFAHLARRLGCDSAATLARQIEQRMAFARELWHG